MVSFHLKAVAPALLSSLVLSAPVVFGQTAESPDMRPVAHDRFQRYVEATVGPLALLETVAWAGVAQAQNTPADWGRDSSGFVKRYASIIGQGAIQETVTYGLSEVLAVDSGYARSRKSGFLPRAGDAVLQSVASRRTNGSRVVSAPLLAGYAAGGIGMMTWYPAAYTYKDGLRYSALALASKAGVNLIREFVLRR